MASATNILITNAHIFTSDPQNPYAEALAIQDNRIVWVGNQADAEGWLTPETRQIDGQGKTLLPGFIDAHFHLLWGCFWLGNAQLREVANQDGLRNVLLEYAKTNKTTSWVVGRGIKYGIVSTRQELDAIFSDRPVYVGAYDGHTGWANTKALQMAGILDQDKDIGPNGIIVRNEAGIATGELREEDAMNAILNLMPEPDEARRRELLQLGMRQITAAGVTSLHNMNGDMREMLTYAAVEDAGEMLLRVYVPLWVKPEMDESALAEAVQMAQIQGDYARGGAAKFFMDGVWESYTALNLAPYADDPEAQADGIWSLERFTQMAAACDRLGLQIFVHCCGDGAVRRTLDGYEALQRINGKRDSRHRVEHIEVIHPDDLPRFKELGVIASMQPIHAPLSVDTEDIWMDRTGPQRWPYAFAWRTIKDAGAEMAFGTDWAVAPFEPMLNLHAALTRQPYTPEQADQRLTLEELLIGYTRDAAYAEFQEHEKGQIKPGYLADLVLLSEDIFQIPPEELDKVEPLMTMVNGKIVYEA